MINDVTPEQAARKFSTSALNEGFIPEALHSYTDTKNNILYWRIRLKRSDGQKWIRPMYRDENNQYHLGEPPLLNNHLKPLYGLHLLSQNPEATILIVEGEYPADIINQHFNKQHESIIAITSGSATSAENVDWEPLVNRRCIIWPDNDAVGMNYSEQIANKLKQLGCNIELIDIQKLNLAESGDCVDWLKANASANINDLLFLPKVINVLQPPIEAEDKIIARLATLSPLEYDRVRIAEAGKLNVRPATLDNLIKGIKSISRKESKLPFDEVAPWHESINPANLLNEINNTLKRFIICPPETIHAATLWIAMTWFIDVIQIAPLAIITAPEKRCGKSQLLFLLGRLVNRPLTASNITPAALFRSIDVWQPTLLIDEADSFMRENEELRGIINCGHTRDSAKIIRVIGEDYTPTTFNVWGAKALAGIGYLPDTIMDRAITLELRRKLINEKTERLRHAEPHLFTTLTAKLARFAIDYSEQVRQAKPELPDSLNDRAQDNWEPLLAIADIAGNEWPKLVRIAAVKISGDHEQSQSIGVELLSDIQEIFETNQADRITSAELVRGLCSDEEKPWASYNRGAPIKPRQIANRLREFGIISNTIRIGVITAKGYLKSQFTDAFARYLSSINVTASPNN